MDLFIKAIGWAFDLCIYAIFGTFLYWITVGVISFLRGEWRDTNSEEVLFPIQWKYHLPGMIIAILFSFWGMLYWRKYSSMHFFEAVLLCLVPLGLLSWIIGIELIGRIKNRKNAATKVREKHKKRIICRKEGDTILFGPWESKLGPEVVKGYYIGYAWASKQRDLRYLEKHLLFYDELVYGWRRWSSRGRYSPAQISEDQFSKSLRDDIDLALVLWEAHEEGEPDFDQLEDYLEDYFADNDEYDIEAHHFGIGLGILSYIEENREAEK